MSARTPEEIADDIITSHVLIDANDEMTQNGLETLTYRDMLVEVAEQAQMPPDFKPAGERDVYRDEWEKGTAQWSLTLDGWPSKPFVGIDQDITPDQARRIFVMLSDETTP